MPSLTSPAGIDNADRSGTTVNGKPSYTVDQAATQIDRLGFNFQTAAGQPVTVTYGFRASAPTGADVVTGVSGFDRFTQAQIDAATLSFESMSDVANITFVRVGAGDTGDGAYTDSAQILLAGADTLPNGETGVTKHPSATTSAVYINDTYYAGQGSGPGTEQAHTISHELGHSIGFSHPSDYNASTTDPPTYANNASYAEDDRQYSIMSYFGPGQTTGASTGYAYASDSLQLDDIAALQKLYGVNTTTRTGDTVYGFHSNTDRPWFTLTSSTDEITACIWDAGGADTLDFSGYSQDQLIDLREGNFSNVGGQLGNVSIAIGAKIENAIGGSGVDVIDGNALNNVMTGGAGNDQLFGDTGTDTADYSGPASAYRVTSNPDGTWTVQDMRTGSPDGTDTLTSVEKLAFSDVTQTIGVDLPAAISTELTRVLRTSSAIAANLTLDQSLVNATAASAASAVVAAALGTTDVATLTYEFFTGEAPTVSGMDYLISPTGPNATNLNSTYYAGFNLENRYINFASNLGAHGEGTATFQAGYGSLSFYDAFKKAYGVIFGAAPSDATIHAILDPTVSSNGQTLSRQQYFASYGGDGLDGLGTKAAAVGWLLAEAEKAHLGLYAQSNDAFLTDVAINNAPFGVDVVGTYGKAAYVFHG